MIEPQTDAEHADEMNQLHALETYEQQLAFFFACCKYQGSKYTCCYGGRLPTFTQLARYCDCSETAISRIASGITQNPSFRTLNVINAIACISPPAFRSGEIAFRWTKECQARATDADSWLKADPLTRGELMDAIVSGIDLRVRHALAQTELPA